MTQLNIAYVLAPEKREEKPRPLTKEIHLFLSEMYRHLMIICLIDYNKLCMLLFFLKKTTKKTLLTSLQHWLVEHCGAMKRTGVSQSFSLHSDSTSVPSIPPAISGSNKQHPALLALHRQSTSIGSVRPPVQPSQAIQQGRGLEGAPQTLHIPLLQPPFCLQRRVLDEGLFFFFWSSQRDHFRQQGTTKQETFLRGASLDSVGGLVVPDEKLQQLVPPVESVSQLAQLVGHFDGDLLLTISHFRVMSVS